MPLRDKCVQKSLAGYARRVAKELTVFEDVREVCIWYLSCVTLPDVVFVSGFTPIVDVRDPFTFCIFTCIKAVGVSPFPFLDHLCMLFVTYDYYALDLYLLCVVNNSIHLPCPAI